MLRQRGKICGTHFMKPVERSPYVLWRKKILSLCECCVTETETVFFIQRRYHLLPNKNGMPNILKHREIICLLSAFKAGV